MKYAPIYFILILIFCSCYKNKESVSFNNQFYCEYEENGVSELVQGHEYNLNGYNFTNGISKSLISSQPTEKYRFTFSSNVVDRSNEPIINVYPGKFFIQLTTVLTPLYLNEDYNLISSDYLRKFFVEDSIYNFTKTISDEGIRISMKIDTTIYNTLEYYGNQIKPNYNDLNNYYKIIYVEDFYSQLYEKKVIRVTAEFSATVFNYQGDSIRIDNGKICSLYTY